MLLGFRQAETQLRKLGRKAVLQRCQVYSQGFIIRVPLKSTASQVAEDKKSLCSQHFNKVASLQMDRYTLSVDSVLGATALPIYGKYLCPLGSLVSGEEFL